MQASDHQDAASTPYASLQPEFNPKDELVVVELGDVVWEPSNLCRALALLSTSLLLFGSYFAYDSISALTTSLRM